MLHERSITLDEASPCRLGDGHVASLLDPAVLDDPGRVLQHVLVSTDGTVVPLLERCFGESIRLAGHVQSSRPATTTDPTELDLDGEELLHRKVLLQGTSSGYNYVFGDSLLVPERLPPTARDELLSTSRPIGRVLSDHRVETFRELLQIGTRYTPTAGGPPMPFRTYRILIGGRPAMLITEHFPPFTAAGEAWGAATSSEDAASPPMTSLSSGG